MQHYYLLIINNLTIRINMKNIATKFASATKSIGSYTLNLVTNTASATMTFDATPDC